MTELHHPVGCKICKLNEDIIKAGGYKQLLEQMDRELEDPDYDPDEDGWYRT